MEERVPQYLHQPIQILWWDAQEFLTLWVVMIVVVLIQVPLWGWGAFFVFAYYFSGWSAGKTRGFLVHLAYRAGFMTLRGYPAPAAETFHE